MEGSSKAFCPFSDTAKPHANGLTSPDSYHAFERNAFALILDLQHNLVVKHGKGNLSGMATGMAQNVCQALLSCPENGDFRLAGQALYCMIEPRNHVDICEFYKAGNIALECSCKPQFFQKRRMQEIRHGPELCQCLLGDRCRFGNRDLKLRRLAIRTCDDALEVHKQDGE